MSLDTIADFNKRIHTLNPLEPYSWMALYKKTSPLDLARLKQFDHDGYHYAREIDRLRISRLVILGHPHSPIYCDPIVALGPPDEILIGAHNALVYEMGLTGIKAKISVPYFGFRYGEDRYLAEIAPDQSVWKILTEKGVETVRGRMN